MSAYVCDDRTIQLIAVFAALSEPSKSREFMARQNGNACGFHNIDDPDPYATHIASVLHAENVRSVNHRYGESDQYDPPSITLRLSQELQRTAPVQVLKSAQCLDYQSCETSDWTQSEAHQYVERAKYQAMIKLPGWDSANWG